MELGSQLLFTVHKNVIFEVLIAMTKNNTLFRDVTSQSPQKVHICFGGT
jgi:hypothetical protein